METVLTKVAVYFNEHSQQLIDRIFPPPTRQDFGTSKNSQKKYKAKLKKYNNSGVLQQRLNKFRDNFYEYINLGRFNPEGSLISASDWLPQVISDIFGIDVDIYDEQHRSRGFHTNNAYQQRIGLGRVNNIHYISLDGNLEAAWLEEQRESPDITITKVSQTLFANSVCKIKDSNSKFSLLGLK